MLGSNITKVREENGIPIYKAKRMHSDKYIAKNLAKNLIDRSYLKTIIDHSCDVYDEATGDLLLRFRKAEMPTDILETGYNNFKHSIQASANRGDAAGGTVDRLDKDGNPTGVMMAKEVMSGNVGFMDPGGMQRYCRLTAFGREHYETYFKGGKPFVDYIDSKYKELCPEHHARQLKTANETNANYVLWDTSFSTVTVNKNFRTAVHKDGGDHPEGFGNLFVYRRGSWTEGEFTLPEWEVGVDMQNGDMLFVDVHRWHGNQEFRDFDPENGDLRVSFVLYYRTGLRKCLGPTEEVNRVKNQSGQYLRL